MVLQSHICRHPFGDVADLVLDHHDKVGYWNGVNHMDFSGFLVHIKLVYAIMWSIKCTIALCLERKYIYSIRKYLLAEKCSPFSELWASCDCFAGGRSCWWTLTDEGSRVEDQSGCGRCLKRQWILLYWLTLPFTKDFSIALLISFENFSSAFTTWLLGTKGLAFGLFWPVSLMQSLLALDLKWETRDSSIYLTT